MVLARVRVRVDGLDVQPPVGPGGHRRQAVLGDGGAERGHLERGGVDAQQLVTRVAVVVLDLGAGAPVRRGVHDPAAPGDHRGVDLAEAPVARLVADDLADVGEAGERPGGRVVHEQVGVAIDAEVVAHGRQEAAVARDDALAPLRPRVPLVVGPRVQHHLDAGLAVGPGLDDLRRVGRPGRRDGLRRGGHPAASAAVASPAEVAPVPPPAVVAEPPPMAGADAPGGSTTVGGGTVRPCPASSDDPAPSPFEHAPASSARHKVTKPARNVRTDALCQTGRSPQRAAPASRSSAASVRSASTCSGREVPLIHDVRLAIQMYCR